MSNRLRRLTCLSLVALVLSANLWSVGPSALADWLMSEQTKDSITLAEDEHDRAPITSEAIGCNEGCHATNHLQAVPSIAVAAVLPPHSPPDVQCPAVASFLVAESRFRPPRGIFLA